MKKRKTDNLMDGKTVANILFFDGRLVKGEIFASFDIEEIQKRYVIFWDGTKSPSGLYNVYAARYDISLTSLEGVEFDLDDQFTAREVSTIKDVIDTVLAEGVFKRKTVCRYCSAKGLIASVSFE